MFKTIGRDVVQANRLRAKVSTKKRRNLLLQAATKFLTFAARQQQSQSDIKYNQSRLRVHSVHGKHSPTGKYLYQVALSCDDNDPRTIEHTWTIRFSMEEFHLAFSNVEHLKEQFKQVVETMTTGPRVAVTRGSRTLRAAKQDRVRRSIWTCIRVIIGMVVVGVFSLCVRKGLEYIDGNDEEQDWSQTHLGVVALCTMLLCLSMYWLFDFVVLQMLPKSFLHHYHQSQVNTITATLKRELSSPTFIQQMKDNPSLKNLLQFSPQSVRRRLPLVVREGNAMCRVNGRTEFESDQHDNSTRIEGGCCRCSIEFGFGRKWHQRWIVCRPTGISFFRDSSDKAPTHVILFDTTFYTSKGGSDVVINAANGPSSTLIVAGSNAMCELAFTTKHARDEWHKAFHFVSSSVGSGGESSGNGDLGNGDLGNSSGDWTKEHRFGSFAPRRLTNNVMLGVPPQQPPADPPAARWLLNGRGYYALVAEAVSKAKSEVFITGWFLTPEILLTRKATSTPKEINWSLRDACLEVASKGIPVYILIYEEIPQALANNSLRAQKLLESVHPLIHVIRHRSRFTRNVYWSHHEKTVVVDQNVAFVGGIDLALMRYDTSKHALYDGANGGHENALWKYNDYQNIRVVDFKQVEKIDRDVVQRSHVPRQPWRDIACQVFGAVATDVGRHFIERWSHARRLQGGVDYYSQDTALELQAPDRKIILKDGKEDEDGENDKDESSACASSVAAVLKELGATQGPPAMSPKTTLTSCQVLRSVSRWSSGTRHESSIHAAYCSLIENAEQFIYIENQFFASAVVDGDSKMGNRIAAALCSRLIRAIKNKEKFRVVVVMPLFPGFAGEVENDTGNSGPLLTVMHWQYRTICRGQNSILTQLKQAIDKYHHGKEKNTTQTGNISGLAAAAAAAAAVGDVPVVPVPVPGDYIQFYSLRNWSTMGGQQRLVTENVYVHSKALIVDDVSVVVGSANINDRSMLGNRDSEMCMLMEDDTKQFGRSMRSSSMREFFGAAHVDWMNDAVWSSMIARAKQNTVVYREVLLPLPDDTITSWSQLKQLRAARSFQVDQYSPDQMKTPTTKTMEQDLHRMNTEVKGIVVEFPLDFLMDENLAPSIYNNTMGSLAPSIFN